MALKQTGDRGARKVTVPDLTGMTRSQAQTALTNAGLSYSETNENTSTEANGTKIKAGTQTTGTVLLGSTVSYTYYTYVYPGFYHGFSHYGGFYHGFYHGFSHVYGGFYHGFGFGGGYGLNVSSSPWVGVNLNISTEYGYIVPSNLETETVVNTFKIEELEGLEDPTWLNSSTLTISKDTSTISQVSQSMAETLNIINGHHYSPNYYILTKKNDTYAFTSIKEIDESFEVYSFEKEQFVPVTSTEEVAYIDMCYTVKCDPINILVVNDLVVFDKPVE
jgi:hypothetical protein